MNIHIASSLFTVTLLCGCGEQHQPKPIPAIYCTGPYTLVPLGTLAGSSARFESGVMGVGGSRAHGISLDGRVVGTSDTDDESTHAFYWEPGSGMLDLLGPNGTAVGRSVNTSGEIVGSVDEDTAFYGDITGAASPLPGLGGKTVASRINELGQVVGYSTWTSAGGDTAEHAVLWRSAQSAPDDLGRMWLSNGASRAGGINELGDVVGFAEVGAGDRHAFLLSNALTSKRTMHDLGTLGGSNSAAYGVSDTSPAQIVGEADTADGLVHAFWTTVDGSPWDYGTLAGGNTSVAQAINRFGGAVGFSNTDPDGAFSGVEHAVLYGCPAGPRDLNEVIPGATGWLLMEATDLNDAFQIVGTGVDPDGNTAAFVLNPPPH